jgi:protein-disulfide isomerase-like protein with CxxC motif
MDILALQVEQEDEGLIWHAWIDKKFYIDGYGYETVTEVYKAIAERTGLIGAEI